MRSLVVTRRGVRVVNRGHAAEQPEVQTEPDRRHEPGADDPPLVVVIEDDGVMRELVATALRKSGFAVVTGEDGATGLELARRHRPQLVVVDVGLPDLDGFAVARRLRDVPRAQRPGIVVLSSRKRDEDLAAASQVGALDYILKPFKHDRMRERVWAALHAHGATTS